MSAAQTQAARDARWYRLVQYRWACEACGETRMVGVVPWHGDRVRLCQSCYSDGFWRTPHARAGHGINDTHGGDARAGHTEYDTQDRCARAGHQANDTHTPDARAGGPEEDS